jgi:hypothetical protein
MMYKLFKVLTVVTLLILPGRNFGQAPDLSAASDFAVFTAAGAFDVLGASTVVTGDVGTNVGQFTGFPPGTLNGQIHVADEVTAAAAPDVLTAFAYLDGIDCGLVLTTPLGNGQVLTPNVYCLGDASTLNGDLTLDGQDDPNAYFIFQVNGAFATSTLTNVLLINSANLCNVYWQVNGAFTLGEGSAFVGNIIANGAIHLLEGSTLNGRAITQAGAIDLHNNIVKIGLQPDTSLIIAEGPTTFCEGGSVILSGNNGGTWNTGATTSSITVTVSGEYYVTDTTICCVVESNHIIVTINPLPVASVITADGPTTFCDADSVILSGNVGGIWNNGSGTSSITVKSGGDYYVTNTNECGSVTSNHTIITIIECGGGKVIPISTWALILGGILIAVFALIRYRRIF